MTKPTLADLYSGQNPHHHHYASAFSNVASSAAAAAAAAAHQYTPPHTPGMLNDKLSVGYTFSR